MLNLPGSQSCTKNCSLVKNFWQKVFLLLWTNGSVLSVWPLQIRLKTNCDYPRQAAIKPAKLIVKLDYLLVFLEQ